MAITEKPPVVRKFAKTELAKPKPGGRGLEKPWTGYWPSNLEEMPLSDHRDTACPWVGFREFMIFFLRFLHKKISPL